MLYIVIPYNIWVHIGIWGYSTYGKILWKPEGVKHFNTELVVSWLCISLKLRLKSKLFSKLFKTQHIGMLYLQGQSRKTFPLIIQKYLIENEYKCIYNIILYKIN